MRTDLPEPTADERAHSERVAALIRAEIAAGGGAIDFSRYMELALYAPGLGYYAAGTRKFGRDGDFVTAPELGFVFARCLARALAPALRETGGDLLEIGPGSGALAADLLAELERLGALPQRYRLLERSADLRERQQQHLRARLAAPLVDRIEWLDAPPERPWRGVLLANEVLDALPVRAFELDDDGLHARAVGCADDGALAWQRRSADPALAAAVAALGPQVSAWPLPYRSELCTLLGPWLASVTASLERGVALFADYGADRAEYYRPERREGTLRCHFRHRAHGNPLLWPGLQDITAWVDFDALAAAATAAGLTPVAIWTQGRFLIEHGLDEVFGEAHAAAAGESERYRLAQEIKRLTLPGEMGERFRVALFRRAG